MKSGFFQEIFFVFIHMGIYLKYAAHTEELILLSGEQVVAFDVRNINTANLSSSNSSSISNNVV